MLILLLYVLVLIYIFKFVKTITSRDRFELATLRNRHLRQYFTRPLIRHQSYYIIVVIYTIILLMYYYTLK